MSSQLLGVPHKYPFSLWSFADNTLTLVREAVLTAGYGPLTTLAEKAVVSYVPPSVLSCTLLLTLILTETLSVLRNISVGRLRIVTNEFTYEFPVDGNGEEEPHAELRVINDAFWLRLCMMGDLGFAEAYMFGDVYCEDLISTFLVSIQSLLSHPTS